MNIWESMVTAERRQRARDLGIKVSDLEEIEVLQSTLEQSRREVNGDHSLNPTDSSTSRNDTVTTAVSTLREFEVFKPIDDDLPEDEGFEDKLSLQHTNMTSSMPSSSSFPSNNNGGPWQYLPEVVVDRILCYLGDPDSCGYLLMTSKSTFRPSERVYHYLCELIYPRQTVKKAVVLERWKTWKNMLVHRPRLRTNGFYTLRTTYSKQHCNDAFWEEKSSESIEVGASSVYHSRALIVFC